MAPWVLGPQSSQMDDFLHINCRSQQSSRHWRPACCLVSYNTAHPGPLHCRQRPWISKWLRYVVSSSTLLCEGRKQGCFKEVRHMTSVLCYFFFFEVHIAFTFLRFWQWIHAWTYGICILKNVYCAWWQIRLPLWEYPCLGTDGSVRGCGHAWLRPPGKNERLPGRHQCASGNSSSFNWEKECIFEMPLEKKII